MMYIKNTIIQFLRCFKYHRIFRDSHGPHINNLHFKPFILLQFVIIRIFYRQIEGGNLAASKIRNLECPSYEICLIDYGCGKFNRKIHIMEQYP